jgi:hypothetical protein
MSTMQWTILAACAGLYLLFLLWWGGRGQPLTADETTEGLRQLRAVAAGSHSLAHLHEVEQLLAQDDGREFVMFNAVLYRNQAQYPAGMNFGTDPREADKRYGKAIVWPLLKRACLPIFIARRTGQFVNDVQAPDWHYVAMVRYRSRRDFLKFALEIEGKGISVHKWAAIEQTHIFPTRPLVSVWSVRSTIALVLGCGGWLAMRSFV